VQILTLRDAAALVADGMTLALGGMTIYRRPVAFVYELLRRTMPPRNLTLLCFTAGYESDLLIGAGCVSHIRSVYTGLESFGLAPMFTEAVHNGALNVIEETEASLSMGLRARAAGVGFMPSKAWTGTALPALRPDVKTVIDPYSGEVLTAFPALPCDIAILHGLDGDLYGTVRLNANLGVDAELIYTAGKVIVTVERLVEKIEPNSGILVPPPGIDYLVHAHKGAHPTSCFPEYPLDGLELMRYIEYCNAGRFEAYLSEVLEI